MPLAMLLTMLMIAVMKTYFSTLTQMTWYQSDKNITCRFLREQNMFESAAAI